MSDTALTEGPTIPVSELERLRIDPEQHEQRIPFDPELYTEEVLQRLQGDYNIFVERNYNSPVIEDADQEDWLSFKDISDDSLRELQKVRYLCKRQPHCFRALSLYLFYVFGSNFQIELTPVDDDAEEITDAERKANKKITKRSRRLWNEFTEHNQKSWNVLEYGKRVWRDGEQFTHMKKVLWPPEVRFIDREHIGRPVGFPVDTKGIVTAADDPTEVIHYQYIDDDGELIKEIPADQVIHTKIDCDSNEKRGNSRFLPVIRSARLYEAFVYNEITHRQAQASIVLVRKVAGRKGPARIYDNAQTSTSQYREGTVSREKWRPGTILTTSPDVELDFAQPHSDFTDASPLARTLLQELCTATGFTYSQITQDVSGGSFTTELVQESPVLQMIRHEQFVLGQDLKTLFKWVIESAIEAGKLPGVSVDTIWEEYEPNLKFFDPVSRDPLKQAQFLNLLVISNIISRQAARRELNLDNDRIVREIEEDKELMLSDMAWQSNQNPTQDNMKQSSKQNANAGGTNQGGNSKPVNHRDRQPGSPG